MRKVCAKMVPKEHTEEQKQRRVTICQDLLERLDDILVHVITGDETWVYHYDPETKRQIALKNCKFPTAKKIPSVQMKSQSHVAGFFDIRGIVHYEFVPTGQTVNQVYLLEVL